jgi:hypothetical protein
VVKKTVAAIIVLVSHLAAACAPAAPSPTSAPHPTPTLAWILATQSEHLVGIWLNPVGGFWGIGGPYFQFAADGTIKRAETVEGLQEEPHTEGSFWIEDGVYYEEGGYCEPIASYRAYLRIEEGGAMALRFEEIDDPDEECGNERSRVRKATFTRVY